MNEVCFNECLIEMTIKLSGSHTGFIGGMGGGGGGGGVALKTYFLENFVVKSLVVFIFVC